MTYATLSPGGDVVRRVSVVLPSYNRLAFLHAAVNSVLAQTFSDWELLIGDDGSDEETRRYLDSLRDDTRIRVLWLAHSGNPGAVRNAAVRQACGQWLAFLDSDDVWLPDKLERQLRSMDAHPDHHWSYGAIERIDAAGNIIPRRTAARPRPQGDILEDVIRWRAGIAMPTVMVTRELLARVGGFDETQSMHEDFDLWLRLAMASPVTAVDEPLARVRFHAEHYASQGERGFRDWITLFEHWRARVATPRLQRAFDEQCAACVVGIARSKVAEGHRIAALRVLLGERAGAWRHANWWVGVARVTLRSLWPGPRTRGVQRPDPVGS